MKNSIVLLVIVFLIFSCSKKKYNPKKNLTVVFYNVENLFDLEDEEGKQDEEFTPEGTKKWTADRYTKKLSDLSKVLSSVNTKELPEVIGLCEVENKKVVEDLLKTGDFAAENYEVINYESPDFRGIDCALAYNSDEMEVLSSQAIRISFVDEPDYGTRDILYVKGRMNSKQVFHFFVNHWPSRIGGLAKTEPKRMHVASVLKAKVDSILMKESEASILIMGDMNDEPDNKSILETLGASQEFSANSQLVNMMAPLAKEGKGTYNFRGNWNMLDNMIISLALTTEGKGYVCEKMRGNIFRKEWMEYKNDKGEISPNRTYGGPNYYGGISDHFPVYISLSR